MITVFVWRVVGGEVHAHQGRLEAGMRRLVELGADHQGRASAARRNESGRRRRWRLVLVVARAPRQLHAPVLLREVLHGAREGGHRAVGGRCGGGRRRRRIGRGGVQDDRLMVLMAVVDTSSHFIAVCVAHGRQSSVGWL